MALNRDHILAAALGLLDESGVQGFNVRALGARLDTAPTAIYWHVKSKDELLVAVADEVWQEIPLLDPAVVGWRHAAEEMARGLHAMVVRHPWLATLMSTHPIYGLHKARHDDHGLAIYEAAGFSPRRASDVLLTVMTFVLGHALTEAAEQLRLRESTRKLVEPDAELVELMDVVNQFPRLRARMSDDPEPGQGLQFGLDLVLNALEREPSRQIDELSLIHI